MEKLAKKLLVLVVDIDDDFGTKAKVSGPVVGRENNLSAAVKLSLADPEDPDSNTIFKALNIYDKLKKEENEVEIVTVTGDSKLGISSSRKVALQLENVLREFQASGAILVTDGSSDDEVLPIIQSRIKIDAMEKVVVKQAKELEKTYFLLLEKIKDPHYSKILLGIPALIILLFSSMYVFDIKPQYVGLVAGTFLLIKGFSFDEWIGKVASSFKIESSRTLAFIFYVFVGLLMFISLYGSYQAYDKGTGIGLKGIELYAYIFDAFLTPAFFIILVALLVKLVDIHSFNKGKIPLITHISTIITFTLAYVIVKTAILWMVNLYPPYVYFNDLILIIIGAFVVEYLSSYYFKNLKIDLVATMELRGKEVYDAWGNLYGKVIDTDPKKSFLRIASPLGKQYFLKLDKVKEVSESITIE